MPFGEEGNEAHQSGLRSVWGILGPRGSARLWWHCLALQAYMPCRPVRKPSFPIGLPPARGFNVDRELGDSSGGSTYTPSTLKWGRGAQLRLNMQDMLG